MAGRYRHNGIQDKDNESKARARPPWEVTPSQVGLPNIPRVPSCITINQNFEYVEPGTDGVGQCPSAATIGYPRQIDETVSSVASLASSFASGLSSGFSRMSHGTWNTTTNKPKPKCKAIDGMDMSIPMGFPPNGLKRLDQMHLQAGGISQIKGTRDLDSLGDFEYPDGGSNEMAKMHLYRHTGMEQGMKYPEYPVLPKQNGLDNSGMGFSGPTVTERSGGVEFSDLPRINMSSGMNGRQNGLDDTGMNGGNMNSYNRMQDMNMPGQTFMPHTFGGKQNGLDNTGPNRFGQTNMPYPTGGKQNGLDDRGMNPPQLNAEEYGGMTILPMHTK